METDEEVALSPDDSEPGPVRLARMNWAGSLRRELSQRAQQYALKHELPHCLSYGRSPTVCFESYGNSQHGNFLPSTYKAILRNPNWRRRLQKAHSHGRKSLPRQENGIWRELDACTSSDALLMNVFCYPGVFRDGRVGSMLDVTPGATPDLGSRARVPLANGKFDREELPQTERDYGSYQLIRNVLAAHACAGAFCVLTDARRPELIEAWFAVMKCVRPVDLRMRCKVLTWQELAKALPRGLREFLGKKYGIESAP